MGRELACQLHAWVQARFSSLWACDHVRAHTYAPRALAELSIKRALFGYQRRDVDFLIVTRDAELELRAAELRVHCARIQELEATADRLTVQICAREQQVRELRRELELAAAGPAGSVLLVESLARRVEELHSQARGQATRIRLGALRDAAELTSRVNAAMAAPTEGRDTAVEVPIRRVAPRSGDPAATDGVRSPIVLDGPASNGAGALAGPVQVDVGPLADFAQLIRIEDAVKEIDAATEISITRFSGGRATISMNFREPVELLRELEERSDLEFVVRRTGADELVLDVASSSASE